MAENAGKYPIDPASDIGKFRLLSGDSVGVPIEPPTPPVQAEYKTFSDAEIQAFIDMAGGSIALAISIGYGQLGAYWASQSVTIKTDDLSYANTQRSGEWLKLAAYWRDIADGQASGTDGFQIVQTGAAIDYYPEAAPRPFYEDRRFTW